MLEKIFDNEQVRENFKTIHEHKQFKEIINAVEKAVQKNALVGLDDVLGALNFIELDMMSEDSMYIKKPEYFLLHLSESINKFLIVKHQLGLYK